jgi:hypothetical protein
MHVSPPFSAGWMPAGRIVVGLVRLALVLLVLNGRISPFLILVERPTTPKTAPFSTYNRRQFSPV